MFNWLFRAGIYQESGKKSHFVLPFSNRGSEGRVKDFENIDTDGKNRFQFGLFERQMAIPVLSKTLE